jgi:hypothetical protein
MADDALEQDTKAQFNRLALKMMALAEERIDHGNDKLAMEAVRSLGELARKFNPSDLTVGAQEILGEARKVLEEVFADDMHCPVCNAELVPKKPVPRKRTPRRSTK